MAVSQNSNISLLIDASLTSSVDALSTVTDKLFKSYAQAFGQGTGDGQANNYWHSQRTLAASGTENLDFSGVLLSPVTGATLAFTKIRWMLFRADPLNTNSVQVIQAASNGVLAFSGASAGVSLLPGGYFVLAAPNGAGIPVTAATGDLITVTNSSSGTSVNYDVVVIGNAT